MRNRDKLCIPDSSVGVRGGSDDGLTETPGSLCLIVLYSLHTQIILLSLWPMQVKHVPYIPRRDTVGDEDLTISISYKNK